MDQRGRSGLSELLRLDQPLPQAVATSLHNSGHPLVDVVPSGSRPLDPTGLLTSARFAELLAWAEAHYDRVLIDSPPMLVASDAAAVARVAGGLMLVVQPQKNHRRLVVRAVDEARSVGLNLLGVIINRLSTDKGDAYYGDAYGYGYGYGVQYGEDSARLDGASPQGVASSGRSADKAA
jgi:tyrosine-protein kinase Etk/Wzc